MHALSLDAAGVVAYETLMRQGWGEKDEGNEEAPRSVATRLRRKLGDDARKPRYVIDECGPGYRIPEPDEPLRRLEPPLEHPPCGTLRVRRKRKPPATARPAMGGGLARNG